MATTIIDYKSPQVNLKIYTFLPKRFSGDLRGGYTNQSLPKAQRNKDYHVGWCIPGNEFYTDMNEEAMTYAGAMRLFKQAIRAANTNKIQFSLVEPN